MTSFCQPDLFVDPTHKAWPFGDLQPQAYDLIMADPPWLFENWSEAGETKQPDYEMMSDDEILALPVADLARENCLLWLWATGPRLDLAIDTVQRWGFQFKTAGGWDKRRWGLGYMWRSRLEFIVLGTRGAPKIDGAAICNLIEGGAAGHSRKPDAAYGVAERMMAGARRCSLFERPVRPGWEGWGDQYGLPIVRRRKVKPDRVLEPALI